MKLHLSSTPAFRRGRCAGLSLLEMLVAMTISTLVMAGVGSVTIFTARSFVALGNYCLVA